MTRQQFLRSVFGFISAPFALPVWVKAEAAGTSEDIPALEKPLSEWRKLLSRDAYGVLFQGGHRATQQ